jgi:indole-3-glycerol phosphate synthase
MDSQLANFSRSRLKSPFETLHSTRVDTRAFQELIPQIPSDVIRVAESGISSQKDVEIAASAGATVVLVGEALVKSGDPISAMQELLGRR